MYALYNPTIELKKIRNEAGRLVTVKDFMGGEEFPGKENAFRVLLQGPVNWMAAFKVGGKMIKNPEKGSPMPEVCPIVNEL